MARLTAADFFDPGGAISMNHRQARSDHFASLALGRILKSSWMAPAMVPRHERATISGAMPMTRAWSMAYSATPGGSRSGASAEVA